MNSPVLNPIIQNMIWKCSDQALLQDQTSYCRALANNPPTEMVPIWQAALDAIDYEIEMRGEHARAVRHWVIPVVLHEAPF